MAANRRDQAFRVQFETADTCAGFYCFDTQPIQTRRPCFFAAAVGLAETVPIAWARAREPRIVREIAEECPQLPVIFPRAKATLTFATPRAASDPPGEGSGSQRATSTAKAMMSPISSARRA